jgi:hypothetical protein
MNSPQRVCAERAGASKFLTNHSERAELKTPAVPRMSQGTVRTPRSGVRGETAATAELDLCDRIGTLRRHNCRSRAFTHQRTAFRLELCFADDSCQVLRRILPTPCAWWSQTSSYVRRSITSYLPASWGSTRELVSTSSLVPMSRSLWRHFTKRVETQAIGSSRAQA